MLKILLRNKILFVPIIIILHKMIEALADATMAITLQYIDVSKQYVLHLNVHSVICELHLILFKKRLHFFLPLLMYY